jgi:hypothetical protein
MRRRASVQTVHLGLEAIEDGVVRLTGGELRAVLEVSGVNFALLGEGEQEAVVAGFAAFLNSLTFPIQVLARATPLDMEAYLDGLAERAALDPADPLAALGRDHVAFLRRLARNRTLLERRFYVVVPADGEQPRASRPWPLGRRREGPDAGSARRRLTFRCEEVARQLGRCGLGVRRLDSLGLARLYYACWCPELARAQSLERDLADYTALAVRGKDALERRPR